MKNLVMELEIMKIIGKHRNIVNLLGCCSQRGDLLVITEFASRGNLLLFLRSFSRSPCIGSSYVANKPDVEELMGYALQIARGMQFLTEKNVLDWLLDDIASKPRITIDNLEKYLYICFSSAFIETWQLVMFWWMRISL